MDLLRQYWFEIAAGVTAICLLTYNIILSCRLRAYKKMTRLLKGGTLEEHINALEKVFQSQQQTISHISDKVAAVQTKISQFPQHWHLVRYNAFEKTGSDLSFSLALLNDKVDGFIITGIFGREDTRVYAKPVHEGKSQYYLSEEEDLAIKVAMETK
ncbi:MAG: DUF4446 family protein [Eubacteriales bacterium]|nr:DUF4446 family protein [Eubacteriales bacterium]MDD3073362.1 DUF4446 family protein [Eubacteriales bacterium]MDD4078977.1 DUF4446 family protein [Eubacteriales bacterium]